MKLTKENIAVVEWDSHIGKWIEETGILCHDPYVRTHILPLLKPGDVVIDGGACVGDHTLEYAKAVGENGKVIAFEIHPESLECLRYNCAGRPNITIIECALINNRKNVGFRHDKNVGACYLDGTGDVQGVMLDDLHLPRVDFIKLDIEGSELAALQGGINTISTYHPKLLIEMNEGCMSRYGLLYVDVLRFISALNYTCCPLTDNTMSDPQYDLLCTPR